MTDPAKDAERLAENVDERRMFDASNKALALSPLCAVAACLAVWHRMAPSGSQREIMAIFSNECMAADTKIARLTQERDEYLADRETAIARSLQFERAVEIALQERDEARRSAETLEAERDMVVDDFAADCAQPTPNDVERAREIWAECVSSESGYDDGSMRIAAALTAARREGAELRALDEAVIQAARSPKVGPCFVNQHGMHGPPVGMTFHYEDGCEIFFSKLGGGII
jgi:hypothetical protein